MKNLTRLRTITLWTVLIEILLLVLSFILKINHIPGAFVKLVFMLGGIGMAVSVIVFGIWVAGTLFQRKPH